MTSSQTEREEMLKLRENELKALGEKLLNTPSSPVDKLLECLKKLDGLLSIMSQEEKSDTLLPAMKALISSNLFRHSDEEVKILVTSCITQITRITAPDPPFNDDKMKEIFQLIVAAFEKLSDESDRCYDMAVSILDNVSTVRSSVIMLDLECNDLVIQMFEHFLRIIRLNHSGEIFRNVKTIMSTVLEESEDVSSDLLGPLLDSLIKDNQAVSPQSWTLAEQVIAECSDKLKSYVHQAVQSRGRPIDDYAEMVASICHREAETIQHENSNAYRMEPYRGVMIVVVDCNASENSIQDRFIASFYSGCISPNSGFCILSKMIIYSKVQADENKLDICKDADEQPLCVPEGLKLDMTCVRDVTQVMDRTETNIENASCSAMNAENVKKEVSKRQKQQHSDLDKHSKSNNAKPSPESVKESKSETEPNTVLKKRGRKPNSLKNPDEGYKYLMSRERKSAKPAQSIKVHKMVPSENLEKKCRVSIPKTDENADASLPAVVEGSSLDQSRPKRGRPKKRKIADNQDAELLSQSMSKDGLLSPQLEKTSLELPGARTERDSEEIKDKDVEPQPSTRAIRSAAKIGKKTTVAQMESKTFSEDKEQPESALNIDAENIKEGKALVQTNVKKRRRHNATFTKDLNESPVSKELIVESATKSSHRPAETPQTRPKRKCTAAWDEDPLVGRRIKVWWPIDKRFYTGLVVSFDRQKKKHKTLYDDGDMEVLNLEKECWHLIEDDDSPDAEQGTDLEKLEVASDTKGKSKSEQAKRRKAKLSLRSDDGQDSAGNSKSAKVANVNHRKRSKVSASGSKLKSSEDESGPASI
ncbi:hypothetical protein L6164_004557 [Bauhinia variegata]|uniref:Uncharacterized protein n=1 Tax=Bauhinia variegata TaxID=167791 RepID=A0ACB9QAH7_BAUVA|nr:hypothetical protein L6164_004557 [Bauhinia variegata]